MGSRYSAVLTLAIVAVAACGDSTDQTTPGVAPQPSSPSAYITQGAKVRLNLLTAEARNRVVFKDPIQGVKNALGECEFRPDPATMRKSPYTGLVGEYDAETCAGLMYYFPPNDRPHPKPVSEDTTVLVAVAVPQDTAAIHAAARTATTEAVIERIAGDTAWVALYDPRTPVNGAAPTDSTAGWIGAQLPWAGTTLQRVRVERRAGKWRRAHQREGVTTS